MSSHYTEQTGTVDTTDTGAGAQSAAAVTPALQDGAAQAAENPVPEGILHALVVDPSDPDKEVDYDDYAEKMNKPAIRDIMNGYAPGTSPESLAERARTGKYTGSDNVVHGDDVPDLVDEKNPPKTSAEKQEEAAEEAEKAEDSEQDTEQEAEQDAAADEDVDEVHAQAPAQVTVDAPEQDQFDPSEHTVKEVVRYLETVDDAEKKRVIDAEKKSASPRAGVLRAN